MEESVTSVTITKDGLKVTIGGTKMEPKYINIVQCIHESNQKPYTFSVEESVKLNVGDYVLVETTLGPCRMAKCITPSFRIGDWQLRSLYGIEMKNLKPVTHVLRPVAIVNKKSAE